MPGSEATLIHAAQAAAGTCDEAALTADIIALATRYGRYGCRLTALQHTTGWRVNLKRGERSQAAGGFSKCVQAAEEEPTVAERRLKSSATAADNGPVFIAKVVRDWIAAVGHTVFIAPGACELRPASCREKLQYILQVYREAGHKTYRPGHRTEPTWL